MASRKDDNKFMRMQRKIEQLEAALAAKKRKRKRRKKNNKSRRKRHRGDASPKHANTIDFTHPLVPLGQAPHAHTPSLSPALSRPYSLPPHAPLPQHKKRKRKRKRKHKRRNIYASPSKCKHLLERVQAEAAATTKTRSPVDDDYKYWSSKLRIPLLGAIDAAFLAVNPQTSTAMYDREKGFNETLFASYAGPIIETTLGPGSKFDQQNAAYQASLKLARDRRMNHGTFWRKYGVHRPLRFGGKLGVVPELPKWPTPPNSEVRVFFAR